ncbi:MAG: FixH family protein [Caldilineaceae bacterium]|nr:FixH family protein [Caldilineaceae bacterium]
MKRRPATWIALLLVVIPAMLVAACSNTQPAASSDVRVTLEPAPAGEAYLIAVVADVDGNPITDATVALEGNMNHAGMVPVLSEPVRDDADGTADGRYRVPFEFTMLGDWIMSVTVTKADGSEAKTDIDLNVADAGVTVK